MTGIGEKRQGAGVDTARYFHQHEGENDDERPADPSLVRYTGTMAVPVVMTMPAMSMVVARMIMVIVVVIGFRGGMHAYYVPQLAYDGKTSLSLIRIVAKS